jgi:EmrB/QacA subfamily drug resistance transporter
MTTKESNPAASATAREPAPAAAGLGTLLVVLTGVFISTLDFFIVNVAIPSTQRDLSASAAAIQWIVAGFALTYGVGLITGSRLGDIFGRRNMYGIGMALFALSSLGCGIAPNSNTLIVARVVQGAAAALMTPQALAIISTVFSGKALLKAYDAYGLTMGLAAVFGQLIGGLLIKWSPFGWEWRTCFLINLPIAAIALATLKVVPESRRPQRPKLDLPGMIVVTAALTAVILPLIEGRDQGWPLWTWLCFGAAGVLFTVFGVYQYYSGKRGGLPLVDMTLFKERAFTVGLLAQLVFWMGQASFFLVFALYVQEGRGLDALGAGTIFTAIGAGYVVTSMVATKLAVKVGPQILAAGGLCMAVALTILLITVHNIGVGGNIWALVPGLVLDGAGMGFAVAPLAATVLARVKPEHAGAASGVLGTGLQVGNALGVAIIGVIFYNSIHLQDGIGTFGHAFEMSTYYLIAVGLTLATLVQFLPKPKPAAVPVAEAEAPAQAA